ncbi:MAG: hypothetical protein C0503_01045 [Gemmatimonas sp.]|nr:hypothetical protein [Gemmatimonas sp.]
MAERVRSGVRPPLIRREERRRRALLFAIVVALLLGITPVIGHHLLGGIPWLSAERQHLAMVCLVALHELLAPVHGAAHWLLYAGVAFAVIERGRVWLKHARVMRHLPMARVSASSSLGRAAERADLPLHRVRAVRALPVPALTSGLVSPRVLVSATLAERLTEDELTAVLAHEAVHLRRRDPLRLFALRGLASLLFWLPVLRRLAADLEDEVEITADDHVAERLALPLASAILKLGGEQTIPVAGTVGFQRTDLLPRRIRRLAGEDAPATSHTSTRSIAAAAAALLLTWSSGVIVLHPLDAASPGTVGRLAHCVHRETLALAHLFCRTSTGGLAHRDSACAHDSGRPLPTAAN